MNRCRVSDILEEIASNVDDSGICASTDEGKSRIISALNKALPLLMNRVDSRGAMGDWSIPVCGGCFSLPEECQEARQVFVNGFGTIQRDVYWQGTLSTGQNSCGTICGWNEVIDLGDFAIPQPLPNFRPIYIVLAAESNADAGVEVTVEIVNQYGERHKENLTMLPEMGYVQMSEAAVDVTFVGKPITEGAIRMYLLYANGQKFHLCNYNPKVQSGAFRRKKLPAWCRGTNLIRIMGKMRVQKLTSVNDLIPICNTSALRWALSAVTAQERKDWEAYDQTLLRAVNELWRELENQDPPSNMHPITFVMGACGNSQANNWKCFN